MTAIITLFVCVLILSIGFLTGLQFGKATAYSEGYADALSDEDFTQFPYPPFPKDSP